MRETQQIVNMSLFWLSMGSLSDNDDVPWGTAWCVCLKPLLSKDFGENLLNEEKNDGAELAAQIALVFQDSMVPTKMTSRSP